MTFSTCIIALLVTQNDFCLLVSSPYYAVIEKNKIDSTVDLKETDYSIINIKVISLI